MQQCKNNAVMIEKTVQETDMSRNCTYDYSVSCRDNSVVEHR